MKRTTEGFHKQWMKLVRRKQTAIHNAIWDDILFAYSQGDFSKPSGTIPGLWEQLSKTI